MATGICYTQSGTEKRYESGELTISPDKIKLVDFNNISCKPMLTLLFTPSSHPPGVSLEDGTAMYVTQIDTTNVDLSSYLSYTPPDGYELVSESHKNDTGVIEYTLYKDFNFEPYTVHYGTATKSFTEYIRQRKSFYYKKSSKPVPNTNINYYIVFTISGGNLRCKCSGVSDIPGTDNGNFTLQVSLTITDGHDYSIIHYFSWVMKNGIDESQSCIGNIYGGGGFNTRNNWVKDNGDGTKTFYTFLFDTSSLVNG